MLKLNAIVYGRSDIGRKRKRNEDGYKITNFDPSFIPSSAVPIRLTENGLFLIVADGIGGARAGDVASELAISNIIKVCQENIHKRNIKNVLIKSFLNAHEKIIEYSEQHNMIDEIGTTAVAVWLKGNSLRLIWSGDSRCYLLRNEKLKMLSFDHTYLWDKYRKGLLSLEEAFKQREKATLYKSLGDDLTPPKPDYLNLKIRTGDKILLCSDGLNSMLQDYEIEALLNKGLSVEQTVQLLIDTANEAGGDDNITVILTEIAS
jgi:protein phosphatase